MPIFSFSLLFHLENILWNTDNSTQQLQVDDTFTLDLPQRKLIHKETLSNIFCGQPMCGLKPACKIKTEQGFNITSWSIAYLIIRVKLPLAA